ncbi:MULTISPECIES: autotransporter domain-containing protein [unclassified Bradyrhizobium]|uniref:autotransporter outer membrane beta-barrel domain-containing protein n=1 Tax=unclassified Bradyrhizobium TaxID=2631580 RepID=UPI0028F096FE|nr:MULTISPECIES: autotransporter domain-containing protein [unclassified Bradyrhizobium]
MFAAPKSRRWLTLSVLLAGTMLSTQALAIDVANQTDWNTAVAAVAAAGANSTVTINITSGFTLSSSLAQLQAANSNVTVNITGNGQTVNGASSFQGIVVNGANAPTVNISSLAITNTAAIGGNGQNGQNGYYSGGLAYGSGGGGGGGLGAGGGLLVGSGANVTIAAVTFTSNSATGGAGGNGGSAQNAAADPVNGGNGGAGGAANNGGASGGGGAGGTGGHTGTQGTAGTAGAALGDGGGGGGGSGTTNSNTYTNNNPGGSGNANGGNGGTGGDGATNASGAGGPGPGSDGGAGGNGGAGNGGAIYVATGGTLTILDSPISGNTVTGGAAGTPGIGIGPSAINGFSAAAGAAQGAGIFLSGVTANIGVSGGSVTYGDTIGGTGLTTGGVNTAINKTGIGTLVLSATNTFTGNVNISAGTLSVGATANLGNVANDVIISNGGTLAVTGTTTFANGRDFKIAGLSTIDVAGATTTTLQGIVGDGASAGTLVKAGGGILLLSGTNTYTGATNVDAGTLRAGSAGAFGASTVFSVLSGATLDLNGFNKTFGTLSGDGTVTGANATISGSFAPGNGTPASSMAIVGNLAFQSGAQYLVQVNPSTASFATVTGTATLGGAAVTATFANGSYISKQYTILTATGGVSGTFGGVTNTNLPAGFSATLSYDANNAFLNLTMSSSGNINQQNVSNALSNYFNTNGSIPVVFTGLTPAGLTQISGETATGSQQTTFNAMTQFMGVMTDPFIGGRGDQGSAPSGAIGYAEETLAFASKRNPNDALAAIYTKAPAAPVVRPGWSVWAAGFGGSQTTDGNTALGSNNTTSNIYGTAVGADYRFSPSTIAGFSMAGGGTTFSVANGGSGRSDLFQAGAFVRHTVGPAYISAALAYGWQNITTNRTVTVAGVDQLRANFDANTFAGRVEGGYRFVSPWMGFGITPYAAAQFTTFSLPGYAENAVSGANTFALRFGSQNVTDTRSELGLRTDKAYALADGVFTLRSRFAWAYDFNPSRSAGATFQTLPGASFVVNGARQAQNSALTTVSAEMKWRNGWSAAASFEGEFSDVTRSYAGKGIVRYTW